MSMSTSQMAEFSWNWTLAVSPVTGMKFVSMPRTHCEDRAKCNDMTKLADLIATGINASLLTACQLTKQARQTGAQSPIHEQIRAALDSVNRGILGQLNAGIPNDITARAAE